MALVFLGSLLAAQSTAPADKKSPAAPPGDDDEKLLRAAGLPTDGPGLLKFFRDRTPSPDDRVRLAALVKKLGSRSFGARERATQELTTAGERALEFLRPALENPDPEVRRRAEQCVRTIEQVPHAARATAAARLLARRRPDGAAAVLLAFLSSGNWQAVGEDLLEPLSALGLEGGAKGKSPVPAVTAALADPDPARRAAAAHVLGRAAVEHRGPLDKLLTDPAPLVRYHAAVALVLARERRGLPALVALLGDGPADLTWRAEDLLSRIAGEKAPAPVPGAPADAAARKKWHLAWEGWWSAHGAGLDLARLNLDEAALGLTVVCEIDGLGHFPGRVCEFTRGGTLRWSVEKLDSPVDVQRLPSGRILVAEHWAKRVTERDRTGKVLWEHKTSNSPVSAERLRNGNTLIATYSEIIELTPGGKTVFKYTQGGMIYYAVKLPSGHVLFVDSTGKVAELDAAGKVVMSFVPKKYKEGASYGASVEPLPGSRYLVCLSGAGKVVEMDATGTIHWECSLPAPGYTHRLRGGTTLVSCIDERFIVEVDRQGKELWRKKTKGRPFRVRRY
jgi:hypothetical protein